MLIAEKMIASEEGYRADPYYCSEGFPTIGYGQKIGPKGAPLNQYLFSLPEEVARTWLRVHIADLTDIMEQDSELEAAMSRCNGVRKAVLVSMAYQMGLYGLKKFKRMLNHIERGEWTDACNEGFKSRWADQTPNRAERHMDLMESGDIDELEAMYP